MDAIDPAGMPRVPHATAQGTQEGRPHPALRRYVAQYQAVDWSDGFKLLNQRRRGEIPRIKGGLDDMSPDMELKGVGLPNAYDKYSINPKALSDDKPRETAKEGSKSTNASVTTAPAELAEADVPVQGLPAFPSREILMSASPGSVEAGVSSFKYDPFLPSPSGDHEITPDVSSVRPKAKKRKSGAAEPDAPRSYVDSLVKELSKAKGAVEALTARVASLEHAGNIAAKMIEYTSGRVRVEISVSGMTFNVSAVDVIESMSGVVILLPTAGDSMTFTPAMGADTAIVCQKKGIRAETAYTGTSFEMEPFGLFGLAFLKRPGGFEGGASTDKSRQPSVQRSGEIPPSGGEDANADEGLGLSERLSSPRRPPVSELVSKLVEA